MQPITDLTSICNYAMKHIDWELKDHILANDGRFGGLQRSIYLPLRMSG